MARAKATKRPRLTSANETPSGLRRPVEAIPRPRPHITFSLNSGISAAPSRSKTTRRSEFEPRSMTPMRSAAVSGSGSDIRSAHNEPRVASPHRLAAPRQTRVRHEIRVGGEAVFISRHTLVIPGRRQAPALQGIAKIRYHNLVQHLAVNCRVFNRHQRLDAAVEIARHPICRADEYPGPIGGQLAPVAEANDSAVLEEPPDDALDANVFGKAGDPRPQTADPSYHQIDAHTRLRSLIEEVDDGRIHKRVHFCPDLRRFPTLCIFNLSFDQFPQARPEGQRCDRDLFEAGGAGITGHEIE